MTKLCLPFTFIDPTNHASNLVGVTKDNDIV